MRRIGAVHTDGDEIAIFEGDGFVEVVVTAERDDTTKVVTVLLDSVTAKELADLIVAAT